MQSGPDLEHTPADSPRDMHGQSSEGIHKCNRRCCHCAFKSNSPILKENHTQRRQPHHHEHRIAKIIGLVEDCTAKKGVDIAWKTLMDH